MTNTDSLSDLEKGEVNLEYLSNEEELSLKFWGKLENTFLYKFVEGKKF